MARAPKREVAVAVMCANVDKPMADVVPLIKAALNISDDYAYRWYKFCVERNYAPGIVEYKRKAGSPVVIPAADAAALAAASAAADAVADEAEFAAADELRAYVNEVRAAE